MKQDISCEACAKIWRQSVGKYPDENVKLIKGRALRNFFCDTCNLALPRESICYAVSVSTLTAPYYPWETSFIEPIEEPAKEAN